MSVSYKDYYDTLGVSRDASPEAIKRAFRDLARQHHPDKVPAAQREAAETKFKEINEAYEVLKDPDKRKKYDRLGENWDKYGDAQGDEWAGAARGGASRSYAGHGGAYDFSFGGTGFSDFFEQFFGGGNFRDMGFAGGARPRDPVSSRGGDLESDIMVTFEEVARGATRPISFSVTNQVTGQQDRREFKLKIPVGVREGQRLRVAGHGEAGLGAGSSGDLYLNVKYEQHPDFKAKDRDLYYELELAPWEAALGAKVAVPTLDGTVRLTVPPGTSSGRQLRLRGKGLPSGDGSRGDLYATASVVVPSQLSEEEKALWRQLSQVSKFEPRED